MQLPGLASASNGADRATGMGERRIIMRWFMPALLLLGLIRPAASDPRTLPVVAVATDRSVTLDLQEVPLRSALARLFRGTGLSYAVAPDVPNPPITISMQD